MARRALLVFLTATARSCASQAPSLPKATAVFTPTTRSYASQAPSPVPANTTSQALAKPAFSSATVSPASAHGAPPRHLLRYGALAAVAGTGLYFVLASGEDDLDTTIEDTDSKKSDAMPAKKSTAMRYGAVAAAAGAGAGVYWYIASLVKAFKSGAGIPPAAIAMERGPSRYQIRKLTALLQKVYTTARKDQRKSARETLDDREIMNWVNRIKDILTLPNTLKDLYLTLVTVWLPHMVTSWDGEICFVCPFSGWNSVVHVFTPKDGSATSGDKSEDNVVSQPRLQQVVTSLKVRTDYELSAKSNCNFEIPFLKLPSVRTDQELSAKSNYNFEMPFCKLPSVRTDQELSAKSNYNFEMPFCKLPSMKRVEYYNKSGKNTCNFQKPSLYLAIKPSWSEVVAAVVALPLQD